jgi:hypothetical protein
LLPAQSCSTITYVMLNRVASELVDIAMKQNDASKKVSLCGMMLWVTIFSEGMTHSQALDLMKPLSSIFICFLHVSPTSFLVGVFQIMHKHLHLFHAMGVQQLKDSCHEQKLSIILKMAHRNEGRVASVLKMAIL